MTTKLLKTQSIAIVHPSFGPMGGGERVIDVLAEMFPQADFFTIFCDEGELPSNLRGRKITVSKLGWIAKRLKLKPAHLIGLYPWAIEQLDLRGYKLVISSCGPGVIGVHIDQDATHIAYIHTPQRIWWDQYSEYQTRWGIVARSAYVLFASYVRCWEFIAAQRVDVVLSNSQYVAQRVKKYFRRDSIVLYPPVQAAMGYINDERGEYYLSVSRLHSSKRVDLLIRACNRLDRKLIVVGDGDDLAPLRALAGPTIQFRGRVNDVELPELYAKCRAFLFAADEDFGIAPLEAQSFGRPVVAYGHGGSLETVSSGEQAGSVMSGIFFAEQTENSVIDGIIRFEQVENAFSPTEIQARAQSFDTAVFKLKFAEIVHACTADGQQKEPHRG